MPPGAHWLKSTSNPLVHDFSETCRAASSSACSWRGRSPTDPDVLVMDEPTAGMDIASEAAIVAFLQDLNRTRGMTILIVTHLLSLVLNFASSIMLMGSGEVLHGPVDEVLKEDRLTALYRVPIHLGRVAGQRMLVVSRDATRV